MKRLLFVLPLLLMVGCEDKTPTEVTLWGVDYSIENTTELSLSSNQLTGIIPDEICNQGDSTPNLQYNQLCPPYPSCVEDYVGEQDTSDCP